MKGCIIAMGLLLILVALVIFNAIYVRRTVDELLSMIEALPSVPRMDQTPSEIAVIREKLQKHEPFLGITVNYSTLDRASEALISLEANARTGDDLQYATTLALLRDLLSEIARMEKITVENILWLTPPVERSCEPS